MRKIIAMLVMAVFLLVWIVAAATIGSAITEWNGLIQVLFYVFAGIAWVLPLRPLFRWMNARETGRRAS